MSTKSATGFSSAWDAGRKLLLGTFGRHNEFHPMTLQHCGYDKTFQTNHFYHHRTRVQFHHGIITHHSIKPSGPRNSWRACAWFLGSSRIFRSSSCFCCSGALVRIPRGSFRSFPNQKYSQRPKLAVPSQRNHGRWQSGRASQAEENPVADFGSHPL